jgi:hypothetical protein
MIGSEALSPSIHGANSGSARAGAELSARATAIRGRRTVFIRILSQLRREYYVSFKS